MLKRFTVMLLSLVLLLSFTGCENVKLTFGNSSDGSGITIDLNDFIPSDLDIGDLEDNYNDYSDDNFIDDIKPGSSTPSGNSGNSSNSSNSSVTKPNIEVVQPDNNENENTVPATKSAIGKDGKKITLVNAVRVANGTIPMDKGLDFDGKTFTMAVTTEPIFKTNDFARLVSAFESKYNCKIAIKSVSFNSYTNNVYTKMLSGETYDIVYMHGSKFPEMPILDLVEDLSPYITTADYDAGNGGIDIAKSARFVYNGKLGGVVAGEHAVYPLVIYYNKALFAKSGMEDLLTLYNNGNWTWNKFIELASKTKRGYTFGDDTFSYYAVPMSSGVSLWDWINERPIMNWMSDDKIHSKMQIAQTLFQKGICSFNDDGVSGFLDGHTYCRVEESQKYSEYAEVVENHAAFGKDIDNLGIVPIPQNAAEAKSGYPTGWLSAICAGKGSSDPRVAVAFAKFWSTFKDTVADEYELSAENKALCDKLISGNLAIIHGNYATTSQNSNDLFKWDVMRRITLGDNIQNVIKGNSQRINNCINYTLK